MRFRQAEAAAKKHPPEYQSPKASGPLRGMGLPFATETDVSP